ncbi:hypothetical protein, partial [Arachnia propionica]|uniref:hypothetical protein n=1 Tax=Arachnia propionica TaxID=1750 RepID=UPI003C6F9B10
MRTELVQNPLEMAVRNSQPIKSMTILPFRFREHKVHVRRLHRHHEQVWFSRIGGKNRRALRQRSSEIIQHHPQEKLVNRKIYRARRKQSKRWHHGLNSATIIPGFIPRSNTAPRTKPIRNGENQDGGLNHNPSFSLPSTKPIAAHTALDQCLSILHNGQQQYLAATDNSRRDLNQAVFDKIYLDDD